MPTEKDPTQEIQTQVLDGIRKSQEAVIDGMRAWTETIQQLVHQRLHLPTRQPQHPPSQDPTRRLDSPSDQGQQAHSAATISGGSS